nr:hypothetical protein [Tanacetum cinerariifolium]
ESEEEETREKAEESFDLIPRTPEDSEDDGNDRVKSLEVNFLEFMRTNQFPKAVSNIPGIVHQYMQLEMMEAVREAVQIQANRLQDSLQRDNDEFLRTIDDNMKKIIKEQVKTDLSEMELKKILIDKMEGNKSIQRSDEQRNLYKALVKAYEADKTILDSYGESTILKRRRGEHASASTPSKPATRSAGRSTTRTQSRQLSSSESAFAKEPVQTTYQMEEPSLPVFETDTPIDFSNFIMNQLGVDTLTPELLAGPTYKLMRGSCNSLTELEYHLKEVYKVTTDQLDWVNPEGQQYPHNLLQPHPLIPDNQGRRLKATKRGSTLQSQIDADTAHSNPRGFIYQNKDKKNRLMRIDKLHKFSDGTLNDVRNALDDRLKGIRIQYLPTIIGRKGDKDRATAMIQEIDKMLKTRRIMRSLE